MVDMSATSQRAGRIPRAQHRGLAERLAIWILARSERREAEELERIGWDLDARFERQAETRVELERQAVVPPGGRLF
jgi:hypothetical protein